MILRVPHREQGADGLDSGDGGEGQFGFLVVVVDKLMLLVTAAAESLQPFPDSRIHHEVAERSGSIVAQFPQKWSWTILNLKWQKIEKLLENQKITRLL